MSSKFFTNTEGNTLFKKFEGILKAMKTHSFQAVSAYFRSSGYFKMREMLKEVEEIKILVGINVDTLIADAQKRAMLIKPKRNLKKNLSRISKKLNIPKRWKTVSWALSKI